MNNEKPAMLRLISSAVSIATRAGAEVTKIVKTGQLGVIDKGVQDFQTEADRTAQRMIVASLAKRFPKCTIVGEEELIEDQEADSRLIDNSFDPDVLNLTLPNQYEGVTEEQITIWVDPLDGTTEFVKGYLEHVTVLIGISVDGESIAGIINQPFYGYSASSDIEKVTSRTMWGLVGLGCFGVTTKQLPNDKLIVTTTASHGNPKIEQSIAALNPDQVLKVGGAGHKVLLVIEGKAHSYVFASNGCKRWDTSAPEAVLKSLGGRLTDVFGNQIEYRYRTDADYQNYLGIIASTNAQIHNKVIENIPKEVKDQLLEFQNKNLKPKF